jgi:glycosyltransferase involved in cell wall biosynthesis
MNRKSISSVLIVKNEEALLGRCLDSVKESDEIIVCDTGSIDGTVAVASQYTDKIYTDFVWCDDFAKARNHAKSKATGDWILSIDADEYCHDFSKVREAVELAFLAVNCKLVAEDNQQVHDFPRLFKNSDQIWWVGAVHNHLSVIGEPVGDVRITYGYSPAHLTDSDRSLRILEREAALPGHVRETFYLGREYWYRRRYEDCVVALGRYVQQSAFLAEKADAFLIMSRAYWAMSMGNDARDACAQALIINPNFREAVLFMATISGAGSGNPRWEANALQWKRLAETADNRDVLFVRNDV